MSGIPRAAACALVAAATEPVTLTDGRTFSGAANWRYSLRSVVHGAQNFSRPNNYWREAMILPPHLAEDDLGVPDLCPAYEGGRR